MLSQFEIQHTYLEIAVSDGVEPDRIGPHAGVIACGNIPLLPNCGDDEALDLAPRRLVPILPLDARVGGTPLPAVGERKPKTLTPANRSDCFLILCFRSPRQDARWYQSSYKLLSPHSHILLKIRLFSEHKVVCIKLVSREEDQLLTNNLGINFTPWSS